MKLCILAAWRSNGTSHADISQKNLLSHITTNYFDFLQLTTAMITDYKRNSALWVYSKLLVRQHAAGPRYLKTVVPFL